jgi:hypothetical protein
MGDPISVRHAVSSGVSCNHHLLTGEGKAHHGDILREATRLAESGTLVVTSRLLCQRRPALRIP